MARAEHWPRQPVSLKSTLATSVVRCSSVQDCTVMAPVPDCSTTHCQWHGRWSTSGNVNTDNCGPCTQQHTITLVGVGVVSSIAGVGVVSSIAVRPGMVFVHMVWFEWQDGVKSEDIELISRSFDDLNGKIPGVVQVSFGPNTTKASCQSYPARFHIDSTARIK
jgi:hypothetical protein